MVEQYIVYVPTILISVFAGVTRTLLQESKQSVKSFVSSVIISVFVGVIAFNVAISYKLSQDATVVVCGVSAFIADDLLLGLKALGQKIRTNPVGTIWAFIRAFIQKIIK